MLPSILVSILEYVCPQDPPLSWMRSHRPAACQGGSLIRITSREGWLWVEPLGLDDWAEEKDLNSLIYTFFNNIYGGLLTFQALS